ncbi:T9SS type A sorting domain-containing protein [Spirosoma aureum]|uniref:T9SS type A sorting domain-containing protein n=1 Tax=Spirosoma aureum TaxID=2692134 RepID=A0A6G9AXI3_9BACT|nr:T9SS type A sorting domain-containing protein [Spirosoma aureum]QIP17172.1 T9SS type A sorting domain-containing protein [Spirosoma aureum]
MKKDLFLVGLLVVSGSVVAQDYPLQITLSQFVTAGLLIDQKASETIVASNGISQGAMVYYTAGKSVTLQPGFMAQAGSVFTATVANVNGSWPTSEESHLSARVYPNPFVEQTTIDYSIPLRGRVRHTLMDATRRVLRQSEEHDEQSSGNYQIQLKGDNLPAGLYLYKLQLGSESRTLRLLKKP